MAPSVIETSINGEVVNRQVLCDIARAAFEVINRLLARDQLLARQLRSDRTMSRQICREECITVEMAATLRERFPQNVEITLFTPPEETRTGADWDWRFEKSKQAIHARVQAKRVRHTAFGQPDGEGDVRIDQSQLDQLIKTTNAASDKLPGLQAWLATFARFDATPPCGRENLMQCSRHRHERACAGHHACLWIAQASDIQALRVARLTVPQVIEHSVRLDCILPCIDAPGVMKGPAVKGFTLADDLPGYQDCIGDIRGAPALLKSFKGALRIFV